MAPIPPPPHTQSESRYTQAISYNEGLNYLSNIVCVLSLARAMAQEGNFRESVLSFHLEASSLSFLLLRCELQASG